MSLSSNDEYPELLISDLHSVLQPSELTLLSQFVFKGMSIADIAEKSTYLLYRYGFTDGEEHLLIGTAIYFHLTKGRAKKTEEQAMDNLWLELPWWFD